MVSVLDIMLTTWISLMDEMVPLFEVLKSTNEDLTNSLLEKSSNLYNDDEFKENVRTYLQKLKEKTIEIRDKLYESVDNTKEFVNEYFNSSDHSSNEFSTSKPKDLLEKCFANFVTFFCFLPEFDLRNRNVFESGLSNGQTFETNKKLLKTLFEDFVPTFIHDFVFKFTFITKQPPYLIFREQKKNGVSESSKSERPFDLEIKCYSVNIVQDFVNQNKGKWNFRPITNLSVIKREDCFNKNSFDEVAKLSDTKSFFVLRENVWINDMKNLQIKRVVKQKFENGYVGDVLLCICFDIQMGKINLPGWNGHIELKRKVTSMPFAFTIIPVVSSESEILAKISWCRSFNQDSYLSDFKSDSKEYNWPIFRNHLKDLFLNLSDTNLPTDEHFNHLGKMLFGTKNLNEINTCKMTFANYLNILLPTTVSNYKFWDWYLAVIELINTKTVKSYWDNGFISGFISRTESEKLLSKQTKPSLLMRFSDSVIAGIVFSVIYPQINSNVMHIFLERNLFTKSTLGQCFQNLTKTESHMKGIKLVICGPDRVESVENFLNVDSESKRKRTTAKSSTIDITLIMNTGDESPKIKRRLTQKPSIRLKIDTSNFNERENNDILVEIPCKFFQDTDRKTSDDDASSSRASRATRSLSGYSTATEYLSTCDQQELFELFDSDASMQSSSSASLENLVEQFIDLSPTKTKKDDSRDVEEFFYDREKCPSRSAQEKPE